MRLKSVIVGHSVGLAIVVLVALLLAGCPPPETEPKRIDALWEEVPSRPIGVRVHRTPTPTGWLVVTSGGGVAEIDDPAHLWLRHPQRSPDQPEITAGEFGEGEAE